jgi:ribonucrease Y
MEYIIAVIVAVGGFFIGYLFFQKQSKGKIEGATGKAEKIINEARSKEKELLLKAQDKALKIIDDAKIEESQRRKEISGLQNRLEQRESAFSQKLLDLQDKQQKLYDKVNEVQEIKERIKTIKEEQLQKLEEVARLNQEEAKDLLLKNIEEKSAEDLLVRIKKLENDASDRLEEKAKDIMALAMQRMVSSYTVELTTTTIDLPMMK